MDAKSICKTEVHVKLEVTLGQLLSPNGQSTLKNVRTTESVHNKPG